MDAIAEHFGKKIGRAVEEVFAEYRQLIEFLQDGRKVSDYLAGTICQEEENRILRWRFRIQWFDCALLILEGFSQEVERYEPSLQQRAMEYLQEYYRPTAQQIEEAGHSEAAFVLLWSWLLSQGNPLVNRFLRTWKQARAITLPIPAASIYYENGAPYQTLSFKIPAAPTTEQSTSDAELTIGCQVSFYWIEQKEYMRDKTWGKIELHCPGQKCFSIRQKRQFLSMLYVDLYQDSETPSRDWLAQDLKCNGFGEFHIATNLARIKQALDTNSLSCALKLIHS